MRFERSAQVNYQFQIWFAIVFATQRRRHPGFDYSVDNESLETLYWLKWGFVIEITGYVYSQKCKKNAKLNWVITFRILVTFFSKYKQKNASRVSRAQNILTFSFWHFHYTFDYKYSQWSQKQILISASIEFLETYYQHSSQILATNQFSKYPLSTAKWSVVHMKLWAFRIYFQSRQVQKTLVYWFSTNWIYYRLSFLRVFFVTQRIFKFLK